MGIVQHLWQTLYDGTAIHVVGPLFHNIAVHGMATALGFIGF
jgi:hypothetical protein